jgi:hypothetical protein
MAGMALRSLPKRLDWLGNGDCHLQAALRSKGRPLANRIAAAVAFLHNLLLRFPLNLHF